MCDVKDNQELLIIPDEIDEKFLSADKEMYEMLITLKTEEKVFNGENNS